MFISEEIIKNVWDIAYSNLKISIVVKISFYESTGKL